jgi:hypothetical protein
LPRGSHLGLWRVEADGSLDYATSAGSQKVGCPEYYAEGGHKKTRKTTSSKSAISSIITSLFSDILPI